MADQTIPTIQDLRGKIGIGTKDPEFKLQVENTVAAGSNNFILNVRNTTHASDSRAGIAFRMNNNTGTNWDGAGIQAYNNGVDGAGHLGFGSVLNNTFSEHLRIKSDGKVGIGITDPTARLHVFDTGNSEIEVQRHSGALINIQAQAAKGVFGTDSNHPVAFKTNAGERVHITTDGRVGINTVPHTSQQLHIVASSTDTTGLEFSTSFVSNEARILSYDRGSGGGYRPLRLQTSHLKVEISGTQKFTVDASGNTIISGNLTVNGTTTTLNSTTLQIDDKNIELGTVASPSDTTADGGGITLKGASDYYIKWQNSTNSWHFNQGIVVGADGSGKDVTFHSATASRALQWDASAKALKLDDLTTFAVGSSDDLQFYHNTHSYIESKTNHLYINNNAADGKTVFKADDGSGSAQTEFFRIDGGGGTNRFSKPVFMGTGQQIYLSTTGTYITHDGTNHYLINGTGDTTIQNDTADGDIKFKADSGSGSSTTEYFRLDGGVGNVTFSKELKLLDAVQLQLGTDVDMTFMHNDANGILHCSKGDLILKTSSDDVKILAEDDIVLRDIDDSTNFIHCVNGGPVRLYHNGSQRLETTSSGVTISGLSLELFHSGGNNYISSAASGSHLLIRNTGGANVELLVNTSEKGVIAIPNGAVQLYHDNGHRLSTTVDGISLHGNGYVDLPDNGRLRLGTNNDMMFYHASGGSGNNILDFQNHDGLIRNLANDKLFIFQTTSGSTQYEILRLGGNTVDARFSQHVNIGSSGTPKDLTTFGSTSARYMKWDGSADLLNFMDNVKITIGNSNDLQLYHDGNNSTIYDQGSGSLIVATNSFKLLSANQAEQLITAFEDGAVNLFYNNTTRLQTTSTGVRIIGDKFGIYQGIEEDNYYFDDYNGARNVSAILNTQRADIIRYQSFQNLESWNGSAWVDASSQNNNLKNLLDGRTDTSWYVPSTYYKFRFEISASTDWPLRALIGLQTSWSGSSFPECEMIVEEKQTDGTWATKVTAQFTNANGITNWGTMLRADSALHTGRGMTFETRITIDFYGWTPSNSSYTTIPLQNIIISSNYAGSITHDTQNLINYDRDILAPADLTVTGKSLFNGAEDNGGKADFAVATNSGNPQISWRSDQVQIGHTDMNWNGKVYEDGTFNMASWSRHMRFFTQSNTSNAYDIFWETWNGSSLSEKMRLKGDGKLGIGTSSPATKLHVYDSAGPTIRFERGSASKLDFEFGSTNTSLVAAGEIQFRANGGTTNKFVINNSLITSNATTYINANLGLGISSPTAKLDVRGGVFISGNHTDTGGQLNLWCDSNGYGNLAVYNFCIKTGANNSRTNPFFISHIGSVGIGTTSINTGIGLQVASGGIYATNGDGYFDTINAGYFASTRTLNLKSGATGKVILTTGSNDQLKADSGGFVELSHAGSTSGGKFLTRRYSGNDYLSVFSTEYSSGSLCMGYGAAGKYGAAGFVSTYDNFAGHKTILKINHNGVNVLTTGTSQTDTVDADLSMAERFRVQVDKSYFNNGPVGIGTTSPSTPLHIDHTGDKAITIESDGDSDSNFIFMKTSASTAQVYIGHETGTAGANFSGTLAGFAVFGNVSSGMGTQFLTGGGNQHVKMTIRHSGQVGIGVTNPNSYYFSNLVVGDTTSGDHGITIRSSNAAKGVLAFADSDSGTGRYSGYIAYNHSTNDMEFYTLAGNFAMMIDDAQQVGIGTTSPNYLLDVEKAGANMRLYNTTNNGNTDFHLRTAGTTGNSRIFFGDTADSDVGSIIYRHNGNSLAFETNDAEAVRIDSSGRVGIGTTSPAKKLHIIGPDGASGSTSGNSDTSLLIDNDGGNGSIIELMSTSSSKGQIFFTDNVANRGAIIYEHANDKLKLNTSATTAITIDSAQKVGIGTTSPSHQLHLNKENAIAEMEISRGGSDPSTNTDIGRIQFHTDYSGSANEVGHIWVRTNSSAYRTDMRFGVKATAGSEETGLTIHGTNDGPLVGIATTNPQQELEVDGVIKQKVYTVSNLPSASTSTIGSRAFVSDSYYPFSSSYLGSQISGGGSNFSPVYSDGNYWYMG